VVWSREEDIQHDVYRPYYYDRLAAGLDAEGMPIAWNHRVIGSSIIARWAPPMFVNGLDSDAVEGAAGPYNFPNILVDYVRQEPPPGLTTGWWRGVGMTHNAFMVEGFVDELAAAAKKDPVDYRRALLDKGSRARAVLDLVAEKAGWPKALPNGMGRGIAMMLGFGTYIAEVAEVAVDKEGGGARPARRVRGGLRSNGQSRYHQGADRGRDHVRDYRGPLWRNYSQGGAHRAKQFRHLSDAAHQRSADNRGLPD
jgi:CO/xanthine dehydrogenase Mo-binding subunit